MDVTTYSSKNLLILAKIDPNVSWSFESQDITQIKESLDYSINIEFEEQKYGYYPNLGYRNDENDYYKTYQYQRLDLDQQFNNENTRSDGKKNKIFI